MSEQVLGNEHEQGENLTLASSIARRNISEYYWQQNILAETIPVSFEAPTEIAISIQTGATAAILKSLEDPSVQIDPVALSRTLFDDKTIKYIATGDDIELYDEDIADTRAILEEQVRLAWEVFEVDESAQNTMKNLLSAARTVSNMHAIGLWEVFDSDEHYGECIRILHTPQSYADEITATYEAVTSGKILDYINGMVDSILKADLEKGEITIEEYEIEKKEITQELLEDEAFQEDLEKGLVNMRIAANRIIIKGLERFWGETANEEAVSIIGRLVLNQPKTIELSNTQIRGQKRKDFAETLCIEKGWDPNNLSMEQTRQINSLLNSQDFESDS